MKNEYSGKEECAWWKKTTQSREVVLSDRVKEFKDTLNEEKRK